MEIFEVSVGMTHLATLQQSERLRDFTLKADKFQNGELYLHARVQSEWTVCQIQKTRN